MRNANTGVFPCGTGTGTTVRIADRERPPRLDRVGRDFRLGRSRNWTHRSVENVAEFFPQLVENSSRRKNRKRSGPSHRDRAQVVHAVRVVGMRVRIENAIEAIDAGGEQLQPQFRRRVDEQTRACVTLHDRANASSFVSRVRRPAHRALAAELRDAEAGSGTEKGDLHLEITDSADTRSITRFRPSARWSCQSCRMVRLR